MSTIKNTIYQTSTAIEQVQNIEVSDQLQNNLYTLYGIENTKKQGPSQLIFFRIQIALFCS